MLDTTEAAMTEANDFQDSSEVLLSSEKCDIPLTIPHSMFISWAAANSPESGKKKQTVILTIHYEQESSTTELAQNFSLQCSDCNLQSFMLNNNLCSWHNNNIIITTPHNNVITLSPVP